jgi:hypothetical protein
MEEHLIQTISNLNNKSEKEESFLYYLFLSTSIICLIGSLFFHHITASVFFGISFIDIITLKFLNIKTLGTQMEILQFAVEEPNMKAPANKWLKYLDYSNWSIIGLMLFGILSFIAF